MLRETGTISPITRIVQESLKDHRDHGYCRKNWVLLKKYEKTSGMAAEVPNSTALVAAVSLTAFVPAFLE